MNKYDVAVVGGGASGMMAAITAREAGAAVAVLERNPRVGKKILATGNGRCNLSNIYAGPENYHGENPKFAAAALSAFDVKRTLEFFERLGIAPKVEDGGKVYPMSDQASAVLDVLRYEMERVGVEVIADARVAEIRPVKSGFILKTDDGKEFCADKVIFAPGGKAMPSSGSDGGGYDIARGLGHSFVDVFPALVQLKLDGGFFKQIDGVKFVGSAQILSGEVSLAKDRGDILFGNYGVSGPPILQISRRAGELLRSGKNAVLKLTIMDTVSTEDVDKLLNKRFCAAPYKTLEFSMIGLINKRLIPVVLKEAGARDLRTPTGDVSDELRWAIAKILTDWRFTVTGTKSWPSAQVTAGGISTFDVNPQTLESMRVPGLFFCGEVLDVDGDCGGFNLQWAWSSGYVAGKCAAAR